MARSTSSPPTSFANHAQIWQELKQAIAASSGFQRWQRERKLMPETVGQEGQESADLAVRRYLRETLDTLAY